MIEIVCNDEQYTYNVYHIIKTFFSTDKVAQKVDKDAILEVNVIYDNISIFQVEKKEVTQLLERSLRRRYVDQKLYHTLEKRTGKTVQWGLLTGIRPTKLAMRQLEAGSEKESFVRWFHEEYLVSEEKAELAWEIAGREKALLDCLDYEDGYSLYVGIPFCPSVCTYCSFSSGSIGTWKNEVDAYVDAVCKELTYVGRVSREKKLNTIYIGGGTPTTLSAVQMERLLDCIDMNFSREDLLEYTVEAGRPDSITSEKLQVIYAHGITRISINPQTMQQKTLDVIGRKHTVKQIVDTFVLARELGFDNINMDLIAGLPGETPEDMANTLKQIESIKPDSLTVHSLAIKRAAKLGQEKAADSYMEALDEGAGRMAEDLSTMIALARDSAKRMGLYPYYLYRQKNIAGNFENVGYAKVDKAGIYNILIMEEKQSIIAVGAGASTKVVLKNPVQTPGAKKKKETNLIRIENVKAIDAYIARIDEMIERKGEWLWR